MRLAVFSLVATVIYLLLVFTAPEAAGALVWLYVAMVAASGTITLTHHRR